MIWRSSGLSHHAFIFFLFFFFIFFFFFFLGGGCCLFVCLWVISSTKHRKRLSRGIFDTFAAHSGFVHDVTDTDCGAQSGSNHGLCRLSNFHLQQTGPEMK